MPTKRTYQPGQVEPFEVSRSKVDLFLNCPRCFWLDRCRGLGRVSGPGFALNSATDALLKREFDLYRAAGEAHPFMVAKGLDAIPFAHPDLEKWRAMSPGIRHHHPELNLILFGALDDLWINAAGELHVVDYKSTSTTQPISLDDRYRQSVKRQAEFYRWLLEQNGHRTSRTAYFLYVNGDKTCERFDFQLRFQPLLLSHECDEIWIEPTLRGLKATLERSGPPEPGPECEWCPYRTRASEILVSSPEVG